MTYADQITAKEAARKGARAAGVTVYYWRAPASRGWEVSTDAPPDGINFGRCNPPAAEGDE